MGLLSGPLLPGLNMLYDRAVPVGTPQNTASEISAEAKIVGDLRLSFATLDSAVPGHEIDRLFTANSAIPGVVIIEDRHLAGLISREQFLSWMVAPYGPELYRSRPIRRLLERGGRSPLCIPAGEGVGNAARLALARSDEQIYDPLVVTFPDGRFAVLDMQTLLRAVATVLEVQMRRIADTLDELRRTQSHLIQSEKMASLGALVAGVAHEVNTPVGIVLGTATHFADITQRFQGIMAEGRMRRSDLDAYVGQAGEAARLLSMNAARAAALIQSFKQVSVDQTSGERRVFALRHYIEEVLTSLTPQIKKMPVAVTVDCPGDIECDTFPGALSQIITNLVVNSLVHAFDDGRPGSIRILARLESDDVVRLSYADDGKGFAEGDVARAFDPFYTTKRGSGGSGLGLHITYNLVVGVLGGTVNLTSTPGHGASFLIRFPQRAGSSETPG